MRARCHHRSGAASGLARRVAHGMTRFHQNRNGVQAGRVALRRQDGPGHQALSSNRAGALESVAEGQAVLIAETSNSRVICR
jgi:hypothetical protein